MTNNKKIRLVMFENDLRMFELAKLLGISETTLYRRLRTELPEEEQDRIVKAIEERSHENE